MLKNILIILLNKQEKIWWKRLDCLTFDCDRTEENKKEISIMENKLINLVNFKKVLIN